MRATSLPTALPVAAAALALVAAVLAPLAVPSTALAERWLRPVPGEVARPFSYASAAPFTAGAHRGADLAARPGTPVRAACAGRVIHAGAVAGHGGVVSMRCGARRVSYLPLAALTVEAGAAVRAGAPLGVVARGHGGLHVGVRREGDPFGYEDPLTLLSAPERPFAPAPLRVRGRAPRRLAPRAPAPVARRSPLRPDAPRAPAPVAGRSPLRPDAPRARPSSPAPWPVWAGLAALLSGTAGSGTVAVRRRRLARSHLRTATAVGSR